jgi:hypothetical protein
MLSEEDIRSNAISLDVVTDAANMRSHEIRYFQPAPRGARHVWSLFSCLQHSQSSCLHQSCVPTSTFLPPFPRRRFALCTFRAAGVSFRQGSLPSFFGFEFPLLKP